MTQFQVGQTYRTRSICDSNCWFAETIVSRTAKTITTKRGKTFRLSAWNGAETFKPFGSYSMAPILSAEDNR